jgi:S1-C subfamily serine protease
VTALFAALFVLGACAFSMGQDAFSEEPEPVASSLDLDQDEAPPPASELADVIERVLPAVVNVKVRGIRATEFGTENVQGQGSGVVIDADQGIIVTNFHVVADATSVDVVFNDGDRVEGTVIGTEGETSDLAVIKVEKDDLTEIKIGKSSSLRLGDDVIALGFPLGLGGATVTSGILSGDARTIEVPDDSQQDGTKELEGLLQTDAAINPGNSGGALIDAAGRLIGINTAAASAGSAENIGFAISIDSALPVIREIIEEPPQSRAWLGVIIATLDPTIAGELGIDPELEGAVITDIIPDGPAEEAGLAPGDVITRLAGDAVTSQPSLTEALADLDPGDRIAVEVVNDDGTRTVQLTLAQRPATFD